MVAWELASKLGASATRRRWMTQRGDAREALARRGRVMPAAKSAQAFFPRSPRTPRLASVVPTAMAKKKQLERELKAKGDGPSKKRAKRDVAMLDADADSIRTTRILPAVQALSAASPAERADAVAAISHLLKDDNSRLLVLKERVVPKLIEDMLNDSSREVVVASWSALRTVAEEDYGHCINMYKSGILKNIFTAFSEVGGGVLWVARSA